MEANQEIFLTVENKLMVTRGEMGGGMGFKGCTCDEHWMLYVSVESLNCTHETNIMLYVN